MQNIKHVIISCAGLGSRLGLNIPKCLLNVNGRTIIERQLDLFKFIDDVRVVVGFKEFEVMNFIKSIRDDIVFVRNPQYATTTNSYSVYLATKDIEDPHLIVDGDLILNKDSFKDFITCCDKNNLIGITETKTEDAVFVEIGDNFLINKFQRNKKMTYEWSGIAYLYDLKISPNVGYVYKEFEKNLPIQGKVIDCFEIDTKNDFDFASKQIKLFE